jgi:alpha-glucosidase (family GH31 glycosyl hydrolase)
MSKKGDLKVPIQMDDELFDEVISSTALLNLASGEISRVEYIDYDEGVSGLPWENKEYDFSCGKLTNAGKDVEFSVQVNKTTGQYSVTASELQEIKQKAAALFSGVAPE